MDIQWMKILTKYLHVADIVSLFPATYPVLPWKTCNKSVCIFTFSEKDKTQRQFKVYREAKEKEIQDILKKKQLITNKLRKVSYDEFCIYANKKAVIQMFNFKCS